MNLRQRKKAYLKNCVKKSKLFSSFMQNYIKRCIWNARSAYFKSKYKVVFDAIG